MRIESPLVSIVIACYNHEQFVQDSIQSVIDQTYKNIELIVIDDGSKDNSVLKIQEMIDSCKERFIRFEFRNRANVGLSATLNEALEWCRGKYYSALASDDQMLSYKTMDQVKFLEKNQDVSAVFGGVQLIDEHNIKLEKILNQMRSYSFKDILMHKHDLPAPTQMIRMEDIRKVGGYNPDLYIEDWYMWLKLSQHSRLFYLDQVFTLYRQHGNNSSKNFEKMHHARIEILFLFKDSDFYEEALKNIQWMNATERFVSSEKDKIRNISRVIIMNPMKFTYMLVRKIYNQTKSKKTKKKFRY